MNEGLVMAKDEPLFITLEGGEGSGKTTLIDRLSAALADEGYDVVKTREPGGTRLGEEIRKILLNREPNIRIDRYAELMLFLAARTQQIDEIIEPALKAGKIVICDRFNESTIAYQGAARGIGMAEVQKQCELACHGILPTLTFYLDIDPEIGLARTRKVPKATSKAGQIDRIESEKILFHQNVRKAMQALALQNPERIKTIDATLSMDEVFNEALSHIRKAFL
jgi:dTMP kinase